MKRGRRAIRARAYLAFLLALAATGAAFAQPTPSVIEPARTPAQSPATARRIADKWALVIGVSRFQDPSIKLRYPAKDAMDFYDFLLNHGNFQPDHVRILVDEEATRERILDELGDKWLPRVAMPDDLVVIYISSHGSPSAADIGGVNYLVAHNTDKERLYSTGIPIQDLTRLIKERVHSDRVVVILDACHSGAAETESKGLVRQRNLNADDIVQGTGQLVICSSEPTESSWESKKYSNGVFTRKLIEGLALRGDATTLGEAFAHTRDQVAQEVLRDRGVLQRPVLRSAWEGADLVLTAKPANPRPGLPESPPSLAPSATAQASAAADSYARPDREAKVASASPLHKIIPSTVWESYLDKGRKAYEKGSQAEAETLFLAARKEAEKFGAQDPRLATSLDCLAVTAMHQGRLAESEALLKQSVAIRERNVEGEPLPMALALEHLARLYAAQGRYAQAEPPAQRALALWESALGVDQPQIAASLTFLAEILSEQGKPAEAQPLAERAKLVADESLARDDPLAGQIALDLGLIANKAGDSAAAQKWLRSAAAIWERKPSSRLPAVVGAYDALAQLYLRQGKSSSAESYFEKIIAWAKKSTLPLPEDVEEGIKKLSAGYAAQAKVAKVTELETLQALASARRGGREAVYLAYLVRPLALTPPPLPLDLESWTCSEREKGEDDTITSRWSWNRARQQFSAVYSDGKRATIKIEKFDKNEAVLSGTYLLGGSVKYTGVRTGNRVVGTFARWVPFKSQQGSWEASF